MTAVRNPVFPAVVWIWTERDLAVAHRNTAWHPPDTDDETQCQGELICSSDPVACCAIHSIHKTY